MPVDLPSELDFGLVEIGRRLACEIFGRSEESISVVGIDPFHPSRRAANL
jgi:hypothetical protein